MDGFGINKTIIKRDKNGIKKMVLLLAFVTIISGVFVPSAFEVILFFGSYFIMVYIAFCMAPSWISSLTVFSMFYSVNFALGEYYVWKEKYILYYNPFSLVLGSFCLVLIGYYFGKKIKLARLRIKHKRIKFPIVTMNEALIITFVLSFVMLGIYLLKNHAILSGNVQDGRIEAASGNGVFTYIGYLHIMSIPLMMIQCQKKKLNKMVFIVCFGIAFVQLMLVGFRTPAITMIIVMLIIQVENQKMNLRKSIPLVVILILIIAIYGTMRANSTGSELAMSVYGILRSRLFIGMQNLNYVVGCFPQKHGFQHGYTYLINFIMLKPGPDLDFTLWLKEMLGFSFSGGGVTPTVVGEFYLNFGYIGITIGMLLLGFFFARFDRWAISGECGFWKAYLILEFASCGDGGIANIVLSPIIFAIYYWLMMIFVKDTVYMDVVECATPILGKGEVVS